MRLRVVVVGIPGVGKTTVVEKLKALVKGARMVTFGSVMAEEGANLHWTRARDELRKLPVEKQRRLQRVAAVKISRMKDRILLIDTHLFVRTNEGFWPGLPFDVARALKPTHFVLIEASADEVLTRRTIDSTRYRDDLSRKDLEDELSLARSFLAISSTLTGAPMLAVTNSEGRAGDVASALANIINEASA